MEFGSATHLCCCGCGEEVVTPFTPTDWKLTYDGETVSLWPSIGNWNLACRSHYTVSGDRIIEAASWSDDRIAAERFRDKAAKAARYRSPGRTAPGAATPDSKVVEARPAGFFARIGRWFNDRLL
jgi:hypothetical protein